MPRTLLKNACVALLVMVAVGSLAYGVRTGLNDSADLERRAEEVVMFREGDDPYRDEQDMTYPPSALPIFAATVPTSSLTLRRSLWIALNFAAILALCVGVIGTWGRSWPLWDQQMFCLIVAASKPARAGIALGQFHLIPTALLVWAEALAHRAVASGVLVGVALIKPTMAAPYVLLMMVRGRWKALGVAGIVQFVLFLITSWQTKRSPMLLTREWLHNARAQTVQGTIDVPSLLGRWWPTSPIHASAVSVTMMIATGLVLFALRKKHALAMLAISLFAAGVMTYHRHYDMVLLLVAVAAFVDRGVRASSPVWKRWGLAFGLVLMIPSSSRLMGRFEPWYDAGFVVVSYLALGSLVLMTFLEHETSPSDS